jgi:hypothetical protein
MPLAPSRLQDHKDSLISQDCDRWCVRNRLWLPLLAWASGRSTQKRLSWSERRDSRTFLSYPSPMRSFLMPTSGVDFAA